MGDKELSILLKTKDTASDEFKKIDKQARELGQAMREHGVKGGKGLEVIKNEMHKVEAEARKLGVSGTKNLNKLQSDIRRLETQSKVSTNQMGNDFSRMKQAFDFAVIIAAAGKLYDVFESTVIETAKLGDEIATLSQQTGFSAYSLQIMRHQATMTDVDFKNFSKGLMKFNKVVGDAGRGEQAYEKIFRQMGIQIKDRQGQIRDVNDLYKESVDKISKMKTIQEQTAFATQLFGRAGADMLPLLQEGAGGFQKWADEMSRAGAVMSDELVAQGSRYDDMVKRFNLQTDAASIKLAENLLPVLNDAGEALTDFIEGHQEEIDAFAKWWGSGELGVTIYDALEKPFRNFMAWWESGELGIKIYEGTVEPIEDAVNWVRIETTLMKDSTIRTVEEMWDGIIGKFEDGYDDIKKSVSKLVDSVIGSLETMYYDVVGKSIIPDLVTESEDWFNRMGQTLPESAASMVDATNREFDRLAGPAEMARPERASKRKKSKEDIRYEEQMAAYEANQAEIKATESANKQLDQLYKEGLGDHQRAVYEEEQLYQKQLEDARAYRADMSAEQQARYDALGWEGQIEEAHNRRMNQIMGERMANEVKAHQASAKAARDASRKKIGAYKSIASSVASILGAGVKEQAAVMIPLELAEAQSDFAEAGWPPNPLAFAAGLEHIAAAVEWGKAAAAGKSAGGGGGGKGGGRGGGGGGRRGRDRDNLPGRGSESFQQQGLGDITIDTGRLSGKMIMGDAGDIMNWALDELNWKFRQNAKINWV